MILKYGVVVLICSQEELNLFAELEDVPEDALHIDRDYIAYRDDLGGVQLVPRSEGYPNGYSEPVKFIKWYRKVSK